MAPYRQYTCGVILIAVALCALLLGMHARPLISREPLHISDPIFIDVPVLDRYSFSVRIGLLGQRDTRDTR